MEFGLYHYHLLLLLLLHVTGGDGATAVSAMELVVTLSSCCGRCDDESSVDGNLIVGHEIVFISDVKGGPKRQKSISAEAASGCCCYYRKVYLITYMGDAAISVRYWSSVRSTK